jgi:tetratricopeptide (TPR) repeat protein
MSDLESREKESDLNINWVDCLLESRFQFIMAEDFKQAQYANNRISNFFNRVGLYDPLLSLNFEMVNYYNDPIALNWIGRSYGNRGDYEIAREWCIKALDATDGVSENAAEALNNLGVIDLKQGKKDSAKDKFSRALEIRQRIKDRSGEACLLRNLASIDLQENEIGEAKKKLLRSLEIERLSGNRGAQAATLENLAIVDFKQGNLPEAKKKALDTLEIVQQTMDREIIASTLSLLALFDLNLGNYPEAKEFGLKGLKVAQEIMAKEHEAKIWYILGIIGVKSGRTTQGIRLVAIGHLMRNFISCEVAQTILVALNDIAFELKYSQEQFDALIMEAFEAYQKDHGQGLIDAAFPKA